MTGAADDAAGRRSLSPPRRLRACVGCTKAKTRCHFRPENMRRHICNRCEQQKLKCEEKATKGIRKPRRTQTAQRPDETKPSGTSRKRVAKSGLTQVVTPTSRSQADTSPSNGTGSTKGSHVTSQNKASVSMAPAPSGAAPPNSSTASASSLLPPFGLSWRQADEMLMMYRENFMHKFPYVLVGKDQYVQRLFMENPCMFRAIMLAAAPLATSRLRKMKRNVLAYISQHMIVEGERSLDLLQGLLICIAWVDLDNVFDQHITTLIYLALGCAHSLGITKTPLAVLRDLGKDNSPNDMLNKRTVEAMSKVHSLDEQRALLGLSSILSANSSHFGRRNPLDGKYVEICCQSMATSMNNPSDFFLERSMRMTLIGERIAAAIGTPNERERDSPYMFLLEGKSRQCRLELDKILESLETAHIRFRQMKCNFIGPDESELLMKYMKLQHHYILVRLYEPATYMTKEVQPDGQASLYRSLCLNNCLQSAKAFFDTLFTLPTSEMLCQPAALKSHMTVVCTVATRLLLTSAPEWDASLVRLSLDYGGIIDKIIERLNEAEAERKRSLATFADDTDMDPAAHGDDDSETSTVRDLAAKMGMMKSWYTGVIRRQAAAVAGAQAEDVSQNLDLDLDFDMEGLGDFSFDFPGPQGMPGFQGGLLGNTAWNFDDIGV